MTNPKLSPVVALFERAYGKALVLFPKEHRDRMKKTRPVFTVQTKGRKNALGWHWRNRWKDEDGNVHTEINISAEHLTDGPREVMDTLVHEMVHHANALAGIKDTSSNGYHNKNFSRLAEEVGLTVSKGPKGFAYTDTPPETWEIIETWGLDYSVLDKARVPVTKNRKKGSKLKKWACDCGYGIRIAVDPSKVELSCGICGGDVLPAE